MRNATPGRLGIALLVAVSFGVSTSEASAGRHGSVVIENPTSNTLYFQFRLGDEGPWSDETIPPNTRYALYFDLDHNGRAYPPNVRFDCVAGE